MQEDTLQTLVLIKPDAMKNSLTGYVLSQISEFHTGLIFAATKVVHVTDMLAEEHYAEHKGKAFYPPLIEMITGRLHFPGEPHKQRVIAIVYQGPNAVKKVRDVCGPTNPNNAREEKPGCIRSLGAVIYLKDDAGNIIGDRMDNLIHASAKPDEAEREIKIWFRPEEIPAAMRAFPTVTCEDTFYFKDGKLTKKYEKGGICVLAPGDVVWKSDLEALRAAEQGKPSETSLQAVVAKYLLNREAGE
ncbi:MAG: nucleoside-diphosphate kinase [Desulfobacteraceae bacterium]|nr:nucleoside-diphosphate kinase [Desulfobacteraceae bacterium]